MLKHKKFLSILLVLPLFSIFSCAKAKEPYKVEKQEGDDPTHLVVTSTLPTSINSGNKLDISKIEVTYNGTKIDWLGEKNKQFEDETKFFLITNANFPTNSIVTNLEVTTNVDRNDLVFYVSHFDKSAETVFVSKQLKITVINDNAIKPWVWYVVTGVVIFGVIGMVMLTRHYKAKKEGKI